MDQSSIPAMRGDQVAEPRRLGTPGLLLAAAYGMLLAAVPLLHDRAAYFRDDMETQFVPTIVAIGHTIWTAGEVPLLTLLTWAAGNLAVEFQYGIFNPVLLSLYAVLPAFPTQDVAAAFLCVTLTGMLTAGGFALGRALGLPVTLSHAAAASIGGSAFLYYWYAVSWFAGFTSTVFAVWAMAFLLRAHGRRAAYAGAVLAVFLTGTAGGPQALVALGAFTAAWLACLWRAEGWRPAIDAASAAILGVAASAIAAAPLIGAGEVVNKSTAIGNSGLLVVNLRDVLTLSSPFHFGVFAFQTTTVSLVEVPIFFVAWYVVPLLPLMDWRRVRWSDPRVGALIGFVAMMLIATQGPSQLAWMRYPIKYLPYFQIGIVALFLLLLHQAGFAPPSRRRAAVMGAALAVSALSSLQSAPAMPLLHLSVAMLAGMAGLILQRDLAERPRRLGILLWASSWVVAAALRAAIPGPILPDGGAFPSFGVPREIAARMPLTAVPAGYDYVVGDGVAPNSPTDLLRDVPLGQTGLAQGRPMVNGYSPVGHRALTGLMCVAHTAGWLCPETIGGIIAEDPESGARFADLLRVGRIIAERGRRLDDAEARLGPPWREVARTRFAGIFERALPNAALPGSLAWPVSGYHAEPVGSASARHEAWRLLERDPAVTTLIFARLYWPGYTATLDGAPLPVRAHGGVFVAVDLPPGAPGGELVLRFTPAGLREGAVVSGVAILLAILHGAFLHGGRRRSRIDSRPALR